MSNKKYAHEEFFIPLMLLGFLSACNSSDDDASFDLPPQQVVDNYAGFGSGELRRCNFPF